MQHYVTINHQNMGRISGVAKTLSTSNKYVTDLILDSITYKWSISVPIESAISTRYKFRLSERHLPYVEQYANKRHISLTVALNLILNDYFLDQIGTEKPKQSQIVTNQINSQPKQHNLRGNALLQQLKA